MDHVRQKKKSFAGKRAVVAVALAAVVLCTGIAASRIDFSTQRVDREKVAMDTVKSGPLEVKVHANGRLLPRDVEYLASQVVGRVLKTYVKPGAIVAAGDTIAELSNPQLIASAQEARAAWDGAVNQQRATRADLRAATVNQEAILMQARFTLQKAQSRLNAENAIPVGVIPRLEHEATVLNAAQSKEQIALELKRFEAFKENVKERLNVDQSRVDELANAMQRAEDQVDSLKIRAGIDGVVQEMNVDVGQQMQPGSPIGRIARPARLYGELRVAARDATDVQIGQPVSIDTRNGLVDGEVARIDPAVSDGTVVVDVTLKGNIPPSARPQLPVEGTIYVTRLSDAVYVGRPSYVKANASVSLYRVDAGGNYADRTVVKVGKLSTDYMQVLGGLRPGDRIITSETGEWQGKDKILLR